MISARQVAEELIVAERERKELSPFTDAHPDFDVGTAYEAQRLFVQDKLDHGTAWSPVACCTRTGSRSTSAR